MGIEVIGVVGAGQMGSGIAQVFAGKGFKVILGDVSLEIARKGFSKIAQSLEKLVVKGKLTQDERDGLLKNISPVEGLKLMETAQLVVEAATENEALKLDLFKRLDELAAPDAILATNTSSISVTLLASATKRPDKVIGIHFMNPAPVMGLVEIVTGLKTSEDTVRTTVDIVSSLGKTPVISKDSPGFIVNRVLIPMINEAAFLLMEGVATAEDIDSAMRLGANHPMGPLALADLIGLDTVLSILEVLHRDLGEDKYRPCPFLRRYVAAGHLGRKTGRGFFNYAKG